MNLAQFVKDLFLFTDKFDRPIYVRVLRRNKHNTVTHVKKIEIKSIGHPITETWINIEESDLNKEWEQN